MTDSPPGAPRLLIFILTYEAAREISGVLERIPADLGPEFDVEILIVDDASSDGTVKVARSMLERDELSYPWRILVNPANQGYGGNQKIGYRYSIDNKFDLVVMLHGDGQYPPEHIAELARAALSTGAAFGSRFAEKGRAREGGMPLYKYIGNRVLTTVQNKLLSTNLTEFHSGFRAYTTQTLASVPFELNSTNFHFDTEIFIQCLRAGIEIGEISIPTRYGDEICRVPGLNYARNVVSQSLRAALHEKGLFYERKFEVGERRGLYEAKLDFLSPASLMLESISPRSTVLDLGSSDGHLARELRKMDCFVVGVDRELPASADNFNLFLQRDLNQGIPDIETPIDVVLLADVVEHLSSPEDFVADLADLCRARGVERVLVSTGNVAFVIQRLMLLVGQFNYGPRGILDMTHTRLFTATSMTRLFRQAGFRVRYVRGIPAPYPLAIGHGPLSHLLLRLNALLIRLSMRLFSYQLFAELEPPISMDRLVSESTRNGERLREIERLHHQVEPRE